MTYPTSMPRRRFLGLGLGLAATAALGSCGGGSNSRAERDALELPSYLQPREFPGASLSTEPAVLPAYTAYPQPFQSVSRPPGSGGTVTSVHTLFTTPPPAQQDNPWAVELNRRLDVELQPTFVPTSGYGEKLSTMLASGDLPDITWIPNGQVDTGAAGVWRSVTQGAFTDLTDVLSADGIEKFPNLAQLPTYAWRNCAVENAIYGVPRALPLLTACLGLYRHDWAEQVGFTEPPADAAEMRELLTEFTRIRPGETFALARVAGTEADFVNQMFRVPNRWRNNGDGTLTYYIETDEFEAAMEYLVTLYQDGVFHPEANAPGDAAQRARDFITSGQTGFNIASFVPSFGTTGLRGAVAAGDPGADLRPLVPPGHDGGDPLIYQHAGWFGVAAIPAEAGKDQARLEELLGVIDYFAAGFGSEEYVFMNYGVEGRHFTFGADNAPEPSDDPNIAVELNSHYLVQSKEILLYYPGAESDATLAQDALKVAAPFSEPSATYGLYSETELRTLALLDQINIDYRVGILTGRRSLSDLEAWRGEWRDAGGDTVRREFEESLERAENA